jgi:tripartite-type tricarboxylate transporter receptor subunit TctC
MKSTGLRALLMLGVAAMLAVTAARAQEAYPGKPVTLVVPYAAGGPSDSIARLVGEVIGSVLGQQVVIENVAGAGGTTGAARVAKAEPDGYTLLIHHIALAAGATLYPKLAYSTTEAFAGIGLVNSGPFVLNGKKALAAGTIKEALDYIRANKEKVTMGNAGVGSGSNLCNMLIQSALGVKASEVAYRGTGPAMNDLVGGQIDMLCDQSTNAMAQINAGTIKAYAVTSTERLKDLKDLPTMVEAGLAGFEITQWHALYAPKGTPAPVIAKLSAALEKALADSKVLARFADFGTVLFPANARGPAATDARLKAEVQRWAKVIGDAGVKAK